MTSDQPLPLNRRLYALGVHFFTASGAVWGFLAVLAIFKDEYKQAILWMVMAILVDGFDGMLARLADVKTYGREIDGALLDNIVDYFNYVVVPALFLVEGDFLPPAFRLVTAILILLTSAYQFTQVDAKTDESHDYFFKGFPDYWNVVILYMLVMRLNPWVNLGFLIIFNILVFVPIKYLYPSRDTRLKTLTLALSLIYGVVGIFGLIQYPDVPQWVVWVSFIYIAYYVLMSFWPRRKPQAA